MNTYANSVDPDKTVHNKPPNLDQHYALFGSRSLFATTDVPKFKDERRHCKEQGMKMSLFLLLLYKQTYKGKINSRKGAQEPSC